MEKQPNCLNNLKICNASCCKIIGFRVKIINGCMIDKFVLDIITADKKYYYELHGCKVKKLQDRSYEIVLPKEITSKDYKYTEITDNSAIVEIPVICKALKDNKCSIYKENKRPYACKNLTEETKKKYHMTEGCIFE